MLIAGAKISRKKKTFRPTNPCVPNRKADGMGKQSRKRKELDEQRRLEAREDGDEKQRDGLKVFTGLRPDLKDKARIDVICEICGRKENVGENPYWESNCMLVCKSPTCNNALRYFRLI